MTAPSPTSARPTVHLNCAVSADGRLAYAGGQRALLSGPEDLRRVQGLRADLEAILVGIGTVIADDPTLRVHWEQLNRPAGRSPLRVIVDSRGRTPASAHVLDGSQPTLVATSVECERVFPPYVERFRGGLERVSIPDLLADLHHRSIRSLLVEGGGRILSTFVTERLFDVLTVFVAPVIIGGPTAPSMVGAGEIAEGRPLARLHLTSTRKIDGGLLLEYVPA